MNKKILIGGYTVVLIMCLLIIQQILSNKQLDVDVHVQHLLEIKKIQECYLVKFADLSEVKNQEIVLNVEKEEIKRYIEFELQQNAYRKHIVDRIEVKKDDLALSDYRIMDGEDVVKYVEDAPIRVGSGMYDIYLENAIQGLTVGNEHIIDWKVHDEVKKKEWAGKNLKIHITVKALYEVIVPTVEEYALRKGFANVAEYEQYVKKELLLGKKTELEYRTIETVIDEMIEKSKFKFNDDIVVENSIQYYYQYSQMANLYNTDVDEFVVNNLDDYDDVYERCYKESLREIQRYLVIGKYAQMVRIEVLEKELDEYCFDNDIKTEKLTDEDKIYIRYKILEEKVVKHIRKNYVIVKEE